MRKMGKLPPDCIEKCKIILKISASVIPVELRTRGKVFGCSLI